MKTTFDLETLMFQILNTPEVTDIINGGVYKSGDRPDDSELEDVEINTIDLTTDSLPQIATTNVNCYVPDERVQMNGKMQYKKRRRRLESIAKVVLAVLKKNAGKRIDGCIYSIQAQTTLNLTEIHQHYVNIRISWNIQK